MEPVRPTVAHGKAYDSYFSTHFTKYQSLKPQDAVPFYRAMFASVLPPSKDARILELGAGLGKFAYFLKSLEYRNVVCVDISPQLAELARQHAGVEITVVSEPMDFLRAQPERSFDAVFMLDVIEHLPKESVIAYLSAVRRVLKTGGTLHVTTENMASPVGGRIQHYLDFTHEYNFCDVSLAQVLSIAGFSEIRFRPMPDRATGPRSLFYWVLRKILHGVYRMIYTIERPGMVNPRFFGKELIVSAVVHE